MKGLTPEKAVLFIKSVAPAGSTLETTFRPLTDAKKPRSQGLAIDVKTPDGGRARIGFVFAAALGAPDKLGMMVVGMTAKPGCIVSALGKLCYGDAAAFTHTHIKPTVSCHAAGSWQRRAA